MKNLNENRNLEQLENLMILDDQEMLKIKGGGEDREDILIRE